MTFRFLRPDASNVWKNKEILERFSRYRGIIDGKNIARYLIAKTIRCEFDKNSPIEELEKLLGEKSNEFQEILNNEDKSLEDRPIQEPCYIDLASHLASKYLKSCIFCERRCGVNRLKGERGVCFIPEDGYVTSAFLHWGEESVLIPSGTIFFQGCNFACVFCQNFDISQSWKKKRKLSDVARKVKPKELATIAENLGDKGAFNINYVGGDPIPNLHLIIKSLNYQTLNICQLWNSNFFLTEESLNLLIHLMDFWLPDFKYGNNYCAEKLSGVKDYYNVLKRNLKKIHEHGSGEIIIRHLVMPNHIECCSKPILEFINEELPNAVVNIMGQYRPLFKASEYPEINRTPNSTEMNRVKKYASELGILWRPVS
ncbi:MAG: radical SAM protein [Promethearchaeota archaeon]|nr:MAG: radical SAM protein [Candidatus Lokiarchaeota archaeon]